MGRHQQDPFVEGGVFHLYNKVSTEAQLFREPEDYEEFLQKFAKYFEPYFHFLSYALIPNHFHFVVQVKEISPDFLRKEGSVTAQKLLKNTISVDQFLTTVASRFFSSYVMRYNNKYGRSGPLFKSGFKRVQQRSLIKMMYIIAYSHHNALHHGLAESFGDHPYDSYRAILSASPTKIARHLVLELFGGKELFLKYHEEFRKDWRKNRHP